MLWVDTMQAFVILGGLMSVLVVGIIRVGGLSEVVRLAGENGRNTFNR